MQLVAFSSFQFLPILEHILHTIHLPISKDMRVAADDLVVDAFDHLVDVEFAIFIGNLGMQGDLEQQVAELLAHMRRVIRIQGSQGFVGLFEQVGAQGLVVLFPIPGAAIGGTQVGNDLLEGFEGGAFFQGGQVEAGQQPDGLALVDGMQRGDLPPAA